ncbi:MAG: WD40 repeat domain-containing protein [Gemmataceae bacterium]|nr:WD40 repeat domain-containing protein [Gemmataceae bacterium]
MKPTAPRHPPLKSAPDAFLAPNRPIWLRFVTALALAGALLAGAVLAQPPTTPKKPEVGPPPQTTPLSAGLGRARIPRAALAQLGGGDPDLAPAELVGILGDGRFRLPAAGSFPAFSPDGKRLAVPAGNHVLLFDAQSGQLLRHLTGHFNLVLRVRFSPDGRWLASSSEDRTILLRKADSGRLVHTLTGHTHHVWGLAFSPDSRALATGGLDGNVRLWDVATGKLRRLVTSKPGTLSHAGWVFSVAFSPDGKRLASAAADQVVRVWEVNSEGAAVILQHRSGSSHLSVAFSADGKLLAAGSDTRLRLWDAATLKETRTVGTPAAVLAFAPDGTLLTGAHVYDPDQPHTCRLWEAATGKPVGEMTLQGRGGLACYDLSADGRTLAGLAYPHERVLRLYDGRTGQPRIPQTGHTLGVEMLAFSSDGKTLVSASEDHTLRVWDLTTGKEVRVLRGHKKNVRGLALSPDGRTAVSGSHDRTVKIWDVPTGRCVRTLEGHEREVETVALSPDGQLAVSGSYDRTLCLWDVRTGERMTLPTPHTGIVEGVAFHPKGRLLASAGSEGLLVLWDTAARKPLRTLRSPSRLFTPAFLPDGETVCAGCEDGKVRLWSCETGEETAAVAGAAGSVHGVAARPGGRMIAGSGQDGTLRLWDLGGQAGEPVRQKVWPLFPMNYWVSGLAMSPGGDLLATGNPDGTIYLFRLAPEGKPLPDRLPAKQETLAEVAQFTRHTHTWVHAAAVLPDGRHALTSAHDGFLRLWDLKTQEQLRLFENAGETVALRVFAQGKRALSVHSDGALRLWDVEAGKLLHLLRGHSGVGRGLAISPDEKLALSAAEDGTVRVWDLETRKELSQFTGHTRREVYSVALSPDGKRALSGGQDRTVRLWDVATCKELRVFEGQHGGTWALAFAPDGKRAAWGDGYGAVSIWDVETGEEVRRLSFGGVWVRSITFTRDGRRLLAGDDSGLFALWDATTGRVLDRTRSPQTLAIALAPDGRHFVTGNGDRLARVWRLPE